MQPNYVDDLSKLKTLKRVFQPGEILISENDDNKVMYILIRGKIQVILNNQILDEISEPGEYFGEINVLLGIPHVATCKAKRETTVLEIPADQIEDFMTSNPRIALNMARKLAKRLICIDKRYLESHMKLNSAIPNAWLNKC